MLERRATYQETFDRFAWQIPERFNIGVACCDRHADGSGRPALIYEDHDRVATLSFDELKRSTNQLANMLRGHGIGAGERVGILLPQRPETAMAHLAIYKLGAIALPLFTQFGPDALEHRLQHSGAAALITDAENIAKIEAIRDALPDLRRIFVIGAAGHLDFHAELAKASDAFVPLDTAANDPALIIYTSGTTGKPKGALHAHRVLLGHLPGVQLPQEFFPQPDDLFWTPADWAWAGGLLDVLLPSLYFGVPVLAARARKFDPEAAFDLMARHKVRNAFIPPTALKLMRQVQNPQRFGYAMRSIGTGGETLGADMLDWSRQTFGFEVNEFYGQTEANLIVSNCAGLFPVRPGSMGRAVPGHRVAVISPEGEALSAREQGLIAVARPDPVMMLEYWRQPEATAGKFVGDWLVTGDTGACDEDGYFWFQGRDDDLISSGSYRIGPGDIEDCIIRHSAVLMVAVVGSPDPVRTEVVKAFVLPKPDIAPSDALAAEIQDFVKARLAAYQYPREIEFVTELPMTATGKIRRKDLRDLEIERKRSRQK
ncbi:AMP-dependent synthetase [Bosea caraganae]|uniref:AMP-dependent synthetase n=1 Tax=Bosea caraganae TaxID=2763117 RepID=A0A370KXP0_9HYPH|nr:acyl-CoA synthetase [Bosea caraganae]RDJ19741.1 AMP-dependent synthetase [Bosea caraganae]RDJ21378.1 AMP-dependent synthetase [Bosea caraganae]